MAFKKIILGHILLARKRESKRDYIGQLIYTSIDNQYVCDGLGTLHATEKA
jgi:hypothetical protein